MQNATKTKNKWLIAALFVHEFTSNYILNKIIKTSLEVLVKPLI